MQLWEQGDISRPSAISKQCNVNKPFNLIKMEAMRFQYYNGPQVVLRNRASKIYLINFKGTFWTI